VSVAANSSLLVANTYKGCELIDIERTFYFMADQKYVTACGEEGEVLIDNTLKELETEFADKLIRVHRNALVCRAKIQNLKRDRDGQFYIELKSTTADSPRKLVHVSRRHVQDVRDWLKSRASPVNV
jgi:two-component system response regulator AlgR